MSSCRCPHMCPPCALSAPHISLCLNTCWVETCWTHLLLLNTTFLLLTPCIPSLTAGLQRLEALAALEQAAGGAGAGGRAEGEGDGEGEPVEAEPVDTDDEEDMDADDYYQVGGSWVEAGWKLGGSWVVAG